MTISDRPVRSNILYDENGNAAVIDPAGVLVLASPGIAVSRGLISGGVCAITGAYGSTSGTGITALRATAYTEQTSNFTATLVSSVSTDSSAGTGARTVKVTYYDQTMTGPFTETLTMNGTTNVTASNSNYCFIERIDVVTVGSNGTNNGTISLKNGGTTVASIAASDGHTYYAHHYIQTGKMFYMKRLILGCLGNSGTCLMRVAYPLTANAFEKQLGGQIRVQTAQPQQVYDMEDLPIAGPARVSLYFKSDSATANTIHASMIYYEF